MIVILIASSPLVRRLRVLLWCPKILHPLGNWFGLVVLGWGCFLCLRGLCGMRCLVDAVFEFLLLVRCCVHDVMCVLLILFRDECVGLFADDECDLCW